jgi:hypothetical protein
MQPTERQWTDRKIDRTYIEIDRTVREILVETGMIER